MDEHRADGDLRAEILRIAEQRGSTRTLCPSDAARSVGGDTWRDLMPAARRIAFELADEGCVDVTQHGEPVEADARGPIRIRWVDRPDRDGRLWPGDHGSSDRTRNGGTGEVPPFPVPAPTSRRARGGGSR